VKRYPFLISVPHGGTNVPAALRGRLALSEQELLYYCDPATRRIFGYRDRVAAYIDTHVSRMAVDLNRPPLPLPGKDPDGIVKRKTIDGKDVYRPGRFPDMETIRRILVRHYFPYHQTIDELIDTGNVAIAFDCHSMLPTGSCGQNDAGKARPLVCLGNNGNSRGRAKKGGVATCPEATIMGLAAAFREVFGDRGRVAINAPFSGGFIVNAHYWHKEVPWVQIEVNRSLYEDGDARAPDPVRIRKLKDDVWGSLVRFYEAAR
jgi:formiminoglutamase